MKHKCEYISVDGVLIYCIYCGEAIETKGKK